jgi:hypothetical protein
LIDIYLGIQLFNADFEMNNCNDIACNYTASGIPGWNIFGYAQLQRSPMIAGEGDWFVDIGNGGISQDVETDIGQQYEISFLLSGNSNCGPGKFIRSFSCVII